MKIIAPPPLIYFLTIVEGVILQYYAPIYIFEPNIPILMLAIILFVAGSVLLIWSVLTMKAVKTSVNPYKTTTTLVIEGPYKFSRNPIYLALTSFYISIVLVYNSLWLFLLLLLLFQYFLVWFASLKISQFLTRILFLLWTFNS